MRDIDVGDSNLPLVKFCRICYFYTVVLTDVKDKNTKNKVNFLIVYCWFECKVSFLWTIYLKLC